MDKKRAWQERIAKEHPTVEYNLSLLDIVSNTAQTHPFLFAEQADDDRYIEPELEHFNHEEILVLIRDYLKMEGYSATVACIDKNHTQVASKPHSLHPPLPHMLQFASRFSPEIPVILTETPPTTLNTDTTPPNRLRDLAILFDQYDDPPPLSSIWQLPSDDHCAQLSMTAKNNTVQNWETKRGYKCRCQFDIIESATLPRLLQQATAIDTPIADSELISEMLSCTGIWGGEMERMLIDRMTGMPLIDDSELPVGSSAPSPAVQSQWREAIATRIAAVLKAATPFAHTHPTLSGHLVAVATALAATQPAEHVQTTVRCALASLTPTLVVPGASLSKTRGRVLPSRGKPPDGHPASPSLLAVTPLSAARHICAALWHMCPAGWEVTAAAARDSVAVLGEETAVTPTLRLDRYLGFTRSLEQSCRLTVGQKTTQTAEIGWWLRVLEHLLRLRCFGGVYAIWRVLSDPSIREINEAAWEPVPEAVTAVVETAARKMKLASPVECAALHAMVVLPALPCLSACMALHSAAGPLKDEDQLRVDPLLKVRRMCIALNAMRDKPYDFETSRHVEQLLESLAAQSPRDTTPV